MRTDFPQQKAGTLYMAEGGQETEIMFKFGHDLPQFAMYTLFDKPQAMAELKSMYCRYLDTAAKHGFVALMGGLDYRASPDWASLLGYSREGLVQVQHQCIQFLKDVAKPYAGQVPNILYVGIIGPRGDAYSLNQTITAESAEDYHSVQLTTLRELGVDLVSAMTFNNIPEAIGLSRAAARADLPLALSFTLDSKSRLKSGPTIKEAIETVDAETGDAKPNFYGINCSHPFEFEPAIEPGAWFQRVRSLRPNAAKMDKISLCQLGHLESGDPQDLGRLMGGVAKRHPHIDIWGGCCGTWETHLDEIAHHVKLAHGLS